MKMKRLRCGIPLMAVRRPAVDDDVQIKRDWIACIQLHIVEA